MRYVIHHSDGVMVVSASTPTEALGTVTTEEPVVMPGLVTAGQYAIVR